MVSMYKQDKTYVNEKITCLVYRLTNETYSNFDVDDK